MLIREKRYGHLESATAAKQQRDLSPRIRGDSINGRYSQDPVKYTRSRGNVWHTEFVVVYLWVILVYHLKNQN